MRADTISNPGEFGRNLTPLCIGDSVNTVLGSVDLDVASDPIANQGIKARRFYTKEDDGYTASWVADNIFINPPGKTVSKGKEVKAAQWVDKLWDCYKNGDFKEAIYLCYRGGSIGGVPYEMLSSDEVLICLTCKGSQEALNKDNQAISGSGRICFEKVDEEDNRVIQDKNTQSSMIVLLSAHPLTRFIFRREFRKYGAILKSCYD